MKKRILVTTGVLTVIFLLAFMMIYAWVAYSLPQTTGRIIVDEDVNITIARDENGVPHISADSWQELYYGVGFAHAQDRLWQLEMNRRIGSGRLAEVVGEKGLATDKYFRTLGFRAVAEKTYQTLSEEEKALLQAYADGINAFLVQNTAVYDLPPEFILLDVKPEPWTPVDSIVWGKMMWLSLSGNSRQELARARLLTQLTPKQVQQLYPPYPGDKEAPLPDLKEIFKTLPLDTLAAYLGDEKPAGYGSNNWVISGAHTKSGKPILANDPHLGLTTPSIWYLVRLHHRKENKNIVGVSFPGSPSVILGRNDTIAWGFTNTYPDTQDYFIEKLLADNQYLTPDGPKDFILRTETIKVKNAADVVLTVRETRHGPVMTDLVDKKRTFTPDNHVLALQWTALMDIDTQVGAVAALMQAGSFDDVVNKAGHYMGPQQNIVYADTKGNIGYFAPALVPVRHKDNAVMGRIPSPGWLAKYDWQGFIPREQLPKRYNVESGVIVTANEKIVDKDYPHYITRDWSLPYRGDRIRHLIQARSDHDLSSMIEIHMDTQSGMARDLSVMLPGETSPDYKAMLDAVHQWDFIMDKNRPEPLIFDRWLKAYNSLVIQDELGPLFATNNGLKPYFLKNVWHADTGMSVSDDYYALPLVNDPDYALWCDNTATVEREKCINLSTQAFEIAMQSLMSTHGKNWQNWRWGDSHFLTQQHRPLGQVRVIGGLFQLSAPQSGGRYTVNVAGNSWRDMDMNSSSFGASYRGLFDMSNLDNSLYILPTGQSGHPLSSHFDDQFKSWMKGDYITIKTDTVIPKGSDILILKRDK